MNHCLIPIKDNSTRLKKKNFKKFLGQPIFYYPLGEAVDSGIFQTISLFSDGNTIERFDFSTFGNANISVVRENRITDSSRTLSDVVVEFINRKNLKEGKLCVLLPTSVFVKSSDLININKSKETYKRLFFGKKLEKKALYSYVNGRRISNKYENTISQNLPQPYVDSGQMYWIDIKDFIKNPIILTEQVSVYYSRDSVDIDTKEDFLDAKRLFKKTFCL